MTNRKSTLGKLICLALCAALAVTLLTACSGSADITGTWILEEIEQAGSLQSELGGVMHEMEELGGSASLSFWQDGQGELSISLWGLGDTQPFTYSVRGSKLIMEGSEVPFRLSGNTMVLEDGEASIRLRRD